MKMSKATDGQFDHLKRICNEAGIKLTHQRFEIFKEMVSATDHPSAETIHRRLQQRLPTIALDTVYRTLTTFDDLGILRKLRLTGERTLFDANLDQHHHFFCTRCKKIEDVYWPEFDNSSLPEGIGSIGKIRARHLELHGLCKKCLAESGE